MSVLPQESPLPRQAFGEDPQVLAEVLRDGVNLAVWTRRLNPALRDFATRTTPIIQQHLSQAQYLPDTMMQAPPPAPSRAGERG